MPAFTPGPWAICEQNKHIVHSTINGRAVALAVGLLDDEQRANARLIAAAPEMENLIRELAALPDEQCMISNLILTARKIIARIDGTENKS